jgi:hypothetical protein
VAEVSTFAQASPVLEATGAADAIPGSLWNLSGIVVVPPASRDIIRAQFLVDQDKKMVSSVILDLYAGREDLMDAASSRWAAVLSRTLPVSCHRTCPETFIRLAAEKVRKSLHVAAFEFFKVEVPGKDMRDLVNSADL